jgi:protein arginine kinase
MEESWQALSKVEGEVGGLLDFAFLPKFGYLSSFPAESGTALGLSAYLHLPALIHAKQFAALWGKQKEESVQAMGLEGSLDEWVGDIVVLKNRYKLGVGEEVIVQCVQTASIRLMALEKSMRTLFKEEMTSDIRDAISRAYGLLMHSYQLQTKEALNAVSLMKLAFDLGLVSQITGGELHDVFLSCRRGHLSFLLNEKSTDPQEIARKRAAFIHKALQGMTLLEN